MKAINRVWICTALWALLLSLPGLAATEFTGIGQLSPIGSEASGVSDNGQVVIGAVFLNGVKKASRWTASEGLVLLGDLALGDSVASALSSNGEVIVGTAYNGSAMEAFRWTADEGMVGLGTTSNRGSAALDVSDDGNTVVGIDGGPAAGCQIGCTPVLGSQQAFVWRSGNGLTLLQTLAGQPLAEAYAVSRDGSLVVGRSFRYQEGVFRGPGLGFITYTLLGFSTFWDANNNANPIANFTPLTPASRVVDITANNEVLINDGSDFFFGPLTGEKPQLSVELNLKTISTDGATIAGSSMVTETAALQHMGQYVDLKPLLMVHFGLDLTGWILREVTGLSADGLTIVGTGINPQGLEEGWIARLDAWPSNAELAAIPRVNGFEIASPLVSAVLPASRSAQVGDVVTAFVTVINKEANLDSFGCRIALKDNVPATLDYHQTDPVTNATIGAQNVPADIAADSSQTYVIGFTPSAPFDPTDVELIYDCANSTPARPLVGINTLNLSASENPVADVVALITTTDLTIPMGGSASAAVAVANVGSSAQITAMMDTAGASLPLQAQICRTEPSTGACIESMTSQSEVTLADNATASYMLTLSATDYIYFDPANNRVFVRFFDENGIPRGATSLSVRTQE